MDGGLLGEWGEEGCPPELVALWNWLECLVAAEHVQCGELGEILCDSRGVLGWVRRRRTRSPGGFLWCVVQISHLRCSTGVPTQHMGALDMVPRGEDGKWGRALYGGRSGAGHGCK